MTDERTTGDAPDIEHVDDEPSSPFRIIERGPLRLIDEGIAGMRPCDHRKAQMILDDDLNSVVCSRCKGLVDPYIALRRFAEWSVDIERERAHLRRERWDFLRMQIIAMLDRKQFDDERDAIRRSIAFYRDESSLDAIRKLHRTISDRVAGDRHARVERRKQKEREQQGVAGKIQPDTIVRGGIVR